MNVYEGFSRRQIGGGIWGTIKRGIRPILSTIVSHLKPIGKAVAKRAAKSVLDLGIGTATSLMSGNFDKEKFKKSLLNEANVLKNEGLDGLKRKFPIEQEGQGYRRSKRIKHASKMSRQKVVRKIARKVRRGKKKVSKQKPIHRRRRQPKKNINKGRVSKKRKRVSAVSHKAIKDIFG